MNNKKKSNNSKVPDIKKFTFHHQYLQTSIGTSISLSEQPVLVCDAVCGMGKTESAIHYINNSNRWNKFIYVTPFLNEIERVKHCCADKHFVAPTNKNKKGTKKANFFELLNQGKNIACTHALFNTFDTSCFEIAKAAGYILIMDEVADVIKPYDIGARDIEILTKDSKLAHIDKKTCQLIWDDEKYHNVKFQEEKRLAELGCLYVYSGITFVWTFPINIFKAFSKVIILTYKFEGQAQCYYYNLFNIPHKYLHVVRELKDGSTVENKFPDPKLTDGYGSKYENTIFHFADEVFDAPQKVNINHFKEKIHILENTKMNAIGDYALKSKGQLSKTWYNKMFSSAESPMAKVLKNNIQNYFWNITETPSADNMWTTYKDYVPQLKGKGYSKGFVPLNARATNEFRNKKACAYMANIYMNPVIANFFTINGIEINEEEYALSELLQWLFRSQLRNDKPINLYLPSQRMRELLDSWDR